jgi:hypothetical protein
LPVYPASQEPVEKAFLVIGPKVAFASPARRVVEYRQLQIPFSAASIVVM